MNTYEQLKESLMSTWATQGDSEDQQSKLQRAIVTVGLFGGRRVGTVGVMRAGEGTNVPPASEWPSWWPPRTPFRPVFL